jgi:hypothetical protein
MLSSKGLDRKWHRDDGKGWCQLFLNSKEEFFYIKYYNEVDKFIQDEEFPNKSLRYVEDAAENWCLGIKKL